MHFSKGWKVLEYGISGSAYVKWIQYFVTSDQVIGNTELGITLEG